MLDIQIADRFFEEENPKECYELVINFEHGDADAYTQEKHIFPENQKDRLLALLDFIIKLVNAQKNHKYYNTREDAYKILGLKCERYSSDYPDLDDLLLVNNVTDMSYNTIAVIEFYSLYYYNFVGCKYNCEIIEG